MRTLVELAARNNASWCDAVCRAHGRPGEFGEILWINRQGSLPYYPAAITLLGAEAAAVQEEELAALLREPALEGCAVKDSFDCLDLRPLGFSPLFVADWLCLSAPTGAKDPGLPWRRAEAAALLDWEQAWAGKAVTEETALFRRSLLWDPDIAFLSAKQDGMLVGGILNRGFGVVGLSNLFGPDEAMELVWRDLAQQASRLFPGLPLVAYETEETLEPPLRAGFARIGPLKVWSRDI